MSEEGKGIPADKGDTQEPSANGGLFCIGRIAGRNRRFVGEDKATELVEYTVNCGERVHKVNDMQPKSYLEMGSDAIIPVDVRMYTNKAGHTLFSLHVAGASQGESF